MTTTNESGLRTFQATAVAIEQATRVAVDSNGLIAAAAATDADIGVTTEAIAASGYGTVKLWGAPGTFLVQAAGAITRGATLYTAAAGEVDDSGTYPAQLVALEAATAQGDMIEVARIRSATYSPGYLSTDVGTVAAAGNSQGTATAIVKAVTYVTGADGTKAVVLPAASAGAVYEIYSVVATNGLVIYPASGDDINDGTTDAAVTIEGKTFARFVAVDSTTWAASYTANS